jgi:hypothetical protein
MAALAQIGSLRKEVEQLGLELERLKKG